YKLNLHGPAVSVFTGCSSSLTSLALACDSLLAFHCNVALVCAATVQFPAVDGYFYAPGGFVCPDGTPRPYDERGLGTVTTNGAAAVAVKRLDDARKDGDRIYAVVLGYASN